jgi:DNA-binding transcriptional ArsR family regulator
MDEATRAATGSSGAADYGAAASLFRALSSPVRIAIVDRLMDGGRCVHELVTELDLPQPQVSQHLRTLREAELVVGVRRGREVAYVLADAHVAHIVHDALHHTGAVPLSELEAEPPSETEGRTA